VGLDRGSEPLILKAFHCGAATGKLHVFVLCLVNLFATGSAVAGMKWHSFAGHL
jgi:hypothetical protein